MFAFCSNSLSLLSAIVQQAPGVHQQRMPTSSLEAFHNNPTFSDITLAAGDTKVHAHKVVLAAHSATLAAMLKVCTHANQTGHLDPLSRLRHNLIVISSCMSPAQEC